MSLSIGSNIASLQAQRRLSDSSKELSKTFERLSSGLRINSAGDDAAGLAISQSLSTDRRVFNQGVRNFNDGLSLLSIADSAVESLSNIVVRFKELAEQSANGTYSISQRSAINKEAQALSKEYTRIAQSTTFNGVNILNGSLSNGVRLQGGYGVDGSILSGVGGAIGNGTFGVAQSIPTSDDGSPGTGVSLGIGDFNGDGINDLVVSDSRSGANGGRIEIKLGNGDGTYRMGQSYDTDAVSASTVGVADLNNDGKLDIIAKQGSASTVLIYLGSGNGTFSLRSTVTGLSNFSLGDLNGDGIVDMVSNVVTADANVRLGNGDGTFGAVSTVSTLYANSRLGDVNNDGILDIVAGGSVSGGRFSVSIGNGNGTFGQATTYLMQSSSMYDIDLGDVNGDGNIDVVMTGVSGAQKSFMTRLGNGDGTFGQAVTTDTPYAGIQTVLGDYNGDGLLDIAAHTTTGFEIRIGNGNGTFGATRTYIGPTTTLTAGDMNGDGVFDIISSGYAETQTRLGISVAGAGALMPFNLTSVYEARSALTAFTSKIQQLSAQRGVIGSFQSRLQFGLNTLQSSSENYAAAESRIKDVDIASESASMVRLNILQKAASSILAQANQQSSLALTLLS